MVGTFKAHWQNFQDGTPGQRFRDRYRANKNRRGRFRLVGRLVRLLLALAATAVGVVLMFIPGPAVVFFFIAGTLLASDSLAIAKLLDRVEVRVRKICTWAMRHWRKLPLAGKVAVVAVMAASSAICTYIAYRFFW
jgi:hypothetical protein